MFQNDTTDGQTILITGATGALGPALAAELLATGSRRQLAVLMRPGDAGLRDRFEQWLDAVEFTLADFKHVISGWRQRVRPITGDVRAGGLGLNTADAAWCRDHTQLILHAAASTAFQAPLDEQRITNVEGTRHALDLARTCRRDPRVLLVSTVCTSGTRVGRIEEAFSPTPPIFGNTYEHSKWEAEELALSSGVPVGIARVSIVIGSHASGAVHRPGALHHLLRWFARGLVPVIPGCSQARLDLISTETAARFVAHALHAKWEPGSIWHVAAGDRAALLRELADLAWTFVHGEGSHERAEATGTPFIVDHDAFDHYRLNCTAPRQRLVRQALDAVNSFMPGITRPRVYDTTHAEALWGGPLPCPDWQTTVRRHLHRAGVVQFQDPQRDAVRVA